jgi:hypothetical protein
MKKTILYLAFTCSFLSSSFTGFSQKIFSAGFRVSNSYGFHSNNTGGSFTPKMGYSIGGLAEFFIEKPWSLRVEALFSNRGFRDKVVFTDASGQAYQEVSVKTNLNYLDVPVMAKISFGSTVKPYFLLGGWGSLFLSGKQKVPPLPIPGSTKAPEPQSYPYKASKYDYGALGGFGIDFKINQFFLFTELRYNYGLANLNKYGTKIRTFEIASGLRF